MNKAHLQRYTLSSYRHYSEAFPDQYCEVPELKEDNQGEWVKYADVVKTLKLSNQKGR